MRVAGILMAFALFAAQPGAAVPLAARRAVADSWDVGDKTETPPCQPIRAELAFPAPRATRRAAEAMLADSSVRSLTDKEAADLLQQGATNDLLAGLLAPQIAKLQAQRRDALVMHVGNWSEADAVTQDELGRLGRVLYPRYRPYLVRAFASERTPSSYLNIKLCGDTLFVDHISIGGEPSRSPLIVFLQSAPVTAIPSWYRSIPSAKPDW